MATLPTFITFVSTYPSTLLGIACFFLLLYTAHLHHKIHRFTRGKTGISLEELMKGCVDSVAKIEEHNELISKHALTLEKKVSHSLRNAQTMRYKAFDVSGSNQSFSVALVNEKGNGVVISSLHSRDRMSTFAKPVENYTSSYDLTEEEQGVIEDSKKAHKTEIKL
jgi:hypothetical protein